VSKAKDTEDAGDHYGAARAQGYWQHIKPDVIHHGMKDLMGSVDETQLSHGAGRHPMVLNPEIKY